MSDSLERLGSGDRLVLVTQSVSWKSLQALKSRLVDRLAEFSRSKDNDERPNRSQNARDFFAAELTHLFLESTPIYSISKNDYTDLDSKSANLLFMLNDIVNEDLIADNKFTTQTLGSRKDLSNHNITDVIYDIEMVSNTYPKLGSLMSFLDESKGLFTLVGNLNWSLFRLLPGYNIEIAMQRITEWKRFVQLLAGQKSRSHILPLASWTQNYEVNTESFNQSTNVPGKNFCVVDSIFRKFHHDCQIPHEIKLRVWEQSSPNYISTTLDMFMSCCSPTLVPDWQEAECGSFQVAPRIGRSESLCQVLRNAYHQKRKLHLLVDQTGIFDITDELPPILTSDNDYTRETMAELFEKKAFIPVSPRLIFENPEIELFNLQEKTALALALSKCLVDFFDKDFDLYSWTWNPDQIFFLRSQRPSSNSRLLYVSLRRPEIISQHVGSILDIGHPILLALAKVLLEIYTGERIQLDIHHRSGDNITTWGQLCCLLSKSQKYENNYYCQAIQGCLYLRLRLTEGQGQSATVTNKWLREAIYESIVHQLELAIPPAVLERKLQNYESNPPPTRRRYGSDQLIMDGFNDPHVRLAALNDIDRSTIRNLCISPAQTLVEMPSLDHYPPSQQATLYFDNPSKSNGNYDDRKYEHSSETLHNARGLSYEHNGTTIMAPSDDRMYEKYTVAVVCAIEFEMSAFRYMLDEEHDDLPRKGGDFNAYVLGQLHGHNIVLACLPGSQGKGAAATVITHLSRTFTCIQWRFMIGIGGGVPSDKHDIRLGDVVVSMPDGPFGGVIQYDLGKETDNEFIPKGFIAQPPPLLRSAVLKMQSNHRQRGNNIDTIINDMMKDKPGLLNYQRPPLDTDVLFDKHYSHIGHHHSTCKNCSRDNSIRRRVRSLQGPYIHYGLIASGDKVMRSAMIRDERLCRMNDILCFEMEAAGLMAEQPCIVIRGVSDYADSHKNDQWHYYAAATAAGCTKELLSYIKV